MQNKSQSTYPNPRDCAFTIVSPQNSRYKFHIIYRTSTFKSEINFIRFVFFCMEKYHGVFIEFEHFDFVYGCIQQMGENLNLRGFLFDLKSHRRQANGKYNVHAMPRKKVHPFTIYLLACTLTFGCKIKKPNQTVVGNQLNENKAYFRGAHNVNRDRKNATNSTKLWYSWLCRWIFVFSKSSCPMLVYQRL